MFWLDGSSKLPFPIVSTRFIGKPCVEHLAEDLASIENQAKIAKSWVEIGDFDRWCHAASDVKGCILVSLKSHLRANRPNPNNIGLDGSCVRWMKTEDFIQTVAVPSSR